MTSEQAAYRRVLRRETHSSRTAPAVIAASVAIIVLLALVIGAVWGLVDPSVGRTASAWLDQAVPPESRQGALIVGGSVGILLALMLLALAVLPGKRARRARTTERLAVLVDDGVLADAVADAVAQRCGIDRRQVSTTLGRSRVSVRITPTSGIRVDEAVAAEAASETVSAIGFAATPRVLVASNGVIA